MELNFADFIARCFIGSVFLYTAVTGIQHYQLHLELMKDKNIPYSEILYLLSLLIRVLGGLALIFHFHAAFFAFLLVIFMVVVTYYFQAFWIEEDGPEKVNLLNHFMMNMSVIGGLLLIVAHS